MNYYYQNLPNKSNRQRKKQTQTTKYIIATALVVILFILLSSLIQNNHEKQINFLITPGESLTSISQRLEENNIINSKFFFRRYLATNKLDTSIRAGSFTLSTNSSNSAVAQILTDSSQTNRMRITIPEGYKISQIDETLTQLGLITAGDFTNCTQNCEIQHSILSNIPTEKNSLEGFLYPDTYFVDPATFTSQDLILGMLDNFQQKLPSNWEEQVASSPANDLYEAITMASIVEREVLSPQDKAIVAGLLWKRLEENWRLDADASLLYDQDDNIITQADLQSDSPYNLRKFRGLSPTPISNPSIETINATLNSTPSNYWFYITTLDTGEVIYAQTINQHNANVNKYLR